MGAIRRTWKRKLAQLALGLSLRDANSQTEKRNPSGGGVMRSIPSQARDPQLSERQRSAGKSQLGFSSSCGFTCERRCGGAALIVPRGVFVWDTPGRRHSERLFAGVLSAGADLFVDNLQT